MSLSPALWDHQAYSEWTGPMLLSWWLKSHISHWKKLLKNLNTKYRKKHFWGFLWFSFQFVAGAQCSRLSKLNCAMNLVRKLDILFVQWGYISTISKRASCQKDYTWLTPPHWSWVVRCNSHTKAFICMKELGKNKSVVEWISLHKFIGKCCFNVLKGWLLKKPLSNQAPNM